MDSYPVQEKYGIVFAFLGDLPENERPPLHTIDEFEQPGWRANKLTVFEVPAFYERSMENGLDPSHNEFVHPAQGSPDINANLRKKPLDVQDVPWGSKFLVRFENKEAEKGTKALADKDTLVDEVTAGSGHVGPNQMITWIRFAETNMFHQYFFEAPIDDTRTRVFFVKHAHLPARPRRPHRPGEPCCGPGRHQHPCRARPRADARHHHEGGARAVRPGRRRLPGLAEEVRPEGLADRHGHAEGKEGQGGLRYSMPGPSTARHPVARGVRN